jgi:hypothetical protein
MKAFTEKATTIEQALAEDLQGLLGRRFNPHRFVPFVIMHEFEGLLFSDCERFCIGIGRPDLLAAFLDIREQFTSPEEINDSPRTAPSKRVCAIVEGYQKPLHGTLAASAIGIDTIAAECPHFSDWISRLEHISA